MNAKQIIALLKNAHADDDTACGLTPADQIAGGLPVENNGNGWITITGTLYPTFASIPWQAQGGAAPATKEDHA